MFGRTLGPCPGPRGQAAGPAHGVRARRAPHGGRIPFPSLVSQAGRRPRAAPERGARPSPASKRSLSRGAPPPPRARPHGNAGLRAPASRAADRKPAAPGASGKRLRAASLRRPRTAKPLRCPSPRFAPECGRACGAPGEGLRAAAGASDEPRRDLPRVPGAPAAVSAPGSCGPGGGPKAGWGSAPSAGPPAPRPPRPWPFPSPTRRFCSISRPSVSRGVLGGAGVGKGGPCARAAGTCSSAGRGRKCCAPPWTRPAGLGS